MPWLASQIPHARLAMIDARHFVQLESPDQFNASMRAFLE
jgi:pimeloyl-ACP methyl ester carboxylesterase